MLSFNSCLFFCAVDNTKQATTELRVSAHRHFVFLQNFVKSSLGRIFAKDLRFCEQLLRKIKVNTIAEEGRTWKKGSKSSPLLCNFLRQIQFLNFKIWTSQEACCLSYHFFKYKPNFTKFCTNTKPVSANSLRHQSHLEELFVTSCILDKFLSTNMVC